MTEKSEKTKVLTVGDGDLTLSLALSRAYGENIIDLTASVLEPNPLEFLRVFPEAPLEELEQHRRVPVLYGVDATQLHLRFPCTKKEETMRESLKPWDLVSFHHPHLGISNVENEDEAQRATLHHRLLCHYLQSAGKVSKLVHVCLTGTQPTTWKLMEAAKLQNLIHVKTLSDTKPFASVWMSNTGTGDGEDHASTNDESLLPEAAKPEPHFAAPRRYRNGKLGKHWLARYGYRHRRTEGVFFQGSSKDANVSESMHFVFTAATTESDGIEATIDSKGDYDTNTTPAYICPICREPFGSEYALREHLLSPVRSVITPRDIPPRIEQKLPRKEESKEEKSTSCDPLQIDVPLKGRGDLDPTNGTVLVVSRDCHGKRLRWFLQHSKIDNIKFTKRLAESAIQSGLVMVNGEVAIDSSRILKDQDSVILLENGEAKDTNDGSEGSNTMVTIQKLSSNNPAVEIVQRSSGWLVVLKPSGMRTKGHTPGTLESSVSEQEGEKYDCLSSLETSCQGLCVLVNAIGTDSNGEKATVPMQNVCTDIQYTIRHFVTVLVHGHLPKSNEWLPYHEATMKIEPKWRQKKKKKKRKLFSELSSSTINDDESSPAVNNQRLVSAEIHSIEATTEKNKNTPGDNPLRLTTVHVVTPEPSSSTICHYFREEGFPVVGDSFCKQEYHKLKRSIRNRLKDKLCIGCYKVEITEEERGNGTKKTHVVEIPTPDKLSADFWGKFLDEETTISRSHKAAT